MGVRREWLVYNNSSAKTMTCNIFQRYSTNRSCSFVVGTSTMKLESVKDHEKSNAHINAARISTAAAGSIATTATVQALIAMTDPTATKMKNLFRNVHALAKRSRPLSDIVWMCQLDDQKGIQVGGSYRNPVEARVFLHYIAQMEREKIRDRLKAASHIGIMTDGSTDSSVKEEEMVYVRTCVAGTVETSFVGITAVEKADAENITTAIKGIMESVCCDWEDKVVAISTDGAAVMVGARSGVVSRLKEKTPYIIGVHCMAHRLELSFKDVIKSISLFQQVEELLSGLYTFYHVSPLNRANLVKSYKDLGMTPLMPTRFGGTRWLAHLSRAVDHFLRGYKAIVQHLDQLRSCDSGAMSVQQCKAKKFAQIAKDSGILQFCGFLCDLVSHLGSLSQSLQRSNITIAEAHSCLCSTQAVLMKYKTRYY
ncbi:zinc finger protein 862-like [Epinephelus moara]|uniref:zinc finger protein 862-like n=1 Tax=Epinephelus moara TaxID=300413 RepID=UPI00214EE7D2|nr:zinc finger protein 862-like [Epinephelus moara]